MLHKHSKSNFRSYNGFDLAVLLLFTKIDPVNCAWARSDERCSNECGVARSRQRALRG